MNNIKLNNGVEVPQEGYGVYQIPLMITERCVSDALEAGYRDTMESIDESLRALSTDYIDLFLLHEPSGDNKERYRAMEDAMKEGKLRAIGLANFLGDNYDDLMRNCHVILQVNQIETHVFRQQEDIHQKMEGQGVIHESWSPLAEGQNGFFHNPVLAAIGKKYGKTLAQVGLRGLLERSIVIIPKSTHKERMKENKDIWDFELDAEDMQAIAKLELGRSQFGWW